MMFCQCQLQWCLNQNEELTNVFSNSERVLKDFYWCVGRFFKLGNSFGNFKRNKVPLTVCRNSTAVYPFFWNHPDVMRGRHSIRFIGMAHDHVARHLALFLSSFSCFFHSSEDKFSA